MRIHPDMNIRFPESKEAELLDAMKSRATPPWRWLQNNPHGEPWDEGYYCFHRDTVGADCACLLFIYRAGPGNFLVVNIIPQVSGRMSVDQYVRVLHDFDERIAEPAASGLGGMTSIDTDKRTLEDYFSPEAIQLLELFCKSSNAADHAAHPSDQLKWIRFLLYVHRRNAQPVPAETFGACLEARNWWPEDDIPRLVNEYDLAMQLLRLADRTAGAV